MDRGGWRPGREGQGPWRRRSPPPLWKFTDHARIPIRWPPSPGCRAGWPAWFFAMTSRQRAASVGRWHGICRERRLALSRRGRLARLAAPSCARGCTSAAAGWPAAPRAGLPRLTASAHAPTDVLRDLLARGRTSSCRRCSRPRVIRRHQPRGAALGRVGARLGPFGNGGARRHRARAPWRGGRRLTGGRRNRGVARSGRVRRGVAGTGHSVSRLPCRRALTWLRDCEPRGHSPERSGCPPVYGRSRAGRSRGNGRGLRHVAGLSGSMRRI